jgi:hypothetical protein
MLEYLFLGNSWNRSVHAFLIGVFFLSALGSIIQAARAYLGLRKIPRLSQVVPSMSAPQPPISIVFAARNESRKLPAALVSLLALDYPSFEVIAVDDRSTDETCTILDDFARRDARLRVIHVQELPAGWLGKTHALQEGASQSTAEWIVFTDADVRFAPDVLQRALTLVNEKKWDHLTLLADVEMHGFWECVALTYFFFCFILGAQPWRASNPKTSTYIGVGAFQLLRRSAYSAIGEHHRLALEIVDDMKLGKLVKEGGFRSGAAAADGWVKVRWQDSFGHVVRGVTKNMFATMGFSVWIAVSAIVTLLISSVLPFAGAIFATGLARLFAGVAALMVVMVHGRLAREGGVSPLYGLTHPLGALIFIYMSLRSMVLTLWRGGVVWRDTFYPLEELKRGAV